jgi:protein Mpv17
MLRAGLTSGTILAGGDLLCQTIQMQYQPAGVAGTEPRKCEERSAPASTSGMHWMSAAVREQLGLADYDLVRTARFFGVGLTLHGPFFNR